MKIKDEDELDKLIICHECYTLHEEVHIVDGTQALCSSCDTILYRYDSRLAHIGLSLSLTGLIFFVIANIFPLIKVEILGHEEFLTLSKTFISLYEHGMYIVATLCLVLIFLFPLLTLCLYILLFGLLKAKKGKEMTKKLLVLLVHLKPWNMSDIFLISLLVALIKLISYAQIEIGISFFALISFVILDLYLKYKIQITEMWMLRKRLYLSKD